jgi:hypothetical protein
VIGGITKTQLTAVLVDVDRRGVRKGDARIRVEGFDANPDEVGPTVSEPFEVVAAGALECQVGVVGRPEIAVVARISDSRVGCNIVLADRVRSVDALWAITSSRSVKVCDKIEPIASSR